MEIWKDVPGYVGLYKVSNYGGRIMSRNRERQQELQPGRVDYARTRLEALGYPVTEVNAMTGRISTNGAIVNLEYMIKKITPDAMK